MKKWLLTALCTLVAGSALAGDWYYIASNGDFSKSVYYDKSSVNSSKGLLQIWYLSVYSPKHAKKIGIDFTLELNEINCKEKSVRTIAGRHYQQEKEFYYGRLPEKWYAIPDTIGEGMVRVVCSKKWGGYYVGSYLWDVVKKESARLE